jgi:mRNA-degrading endonuclease toxin of MazEF toxin-antitoxin module
MAQKRKVNYPRRGEVYLVSFDPTIGSEIQKTRPALIVQNDISNQHSPITSRMISVKPRSRLQSSPLNAVLIRTQNIINGYF